MNNEMTFGEALKLLSNGEKLSRAGWNGKGMFVILNQGTNGEKIAMTAGSVYADHGIKKCEILPHYDMYTVNSTGRRAVLVGWAASQTDLLAEDWGVV